MRAPLPVGQDHVDGLLAALRDFADCRDRAARWGETLAKVLDGGGRLLAVGNGGSAAQAQHLTAELVGRYRDDRRPYSALALHADSSSVTAISNDYGADSVFARQVEAHGRPGDVVVLLSTSGSSTNVLAAAQAAADIGLMTWAVTGPAPNPLAQRCDDAICVRARSTANIQEVHLVVLHLICAAFDAALGVSPTELVAGPDGGVRR